MTQSETRIEHLKLVQGIISRMAGNSAQLKTWAVSLVTAVIVLSGLADKPHWLLAVAGAVPVLIFWVMDAKYLHIERCYVKLYAAILNNEVAPFDLNYIPYMSKVPSFRSVVISWSVASFYVTLILIVSVLAVYLAAFAGTAAPKP